MPEVKMQHYVPRFYLEEFSINPDVDSPQLYCYDKPDRRVFQTAITNVGGEQYFYDTSGDQPFEDFLAKIEGEFADAYRKILDGEDLGDLTENDRTAIAYSVATQEHRTRVFRDEYMEGFEKLANRLREFNLSEELEEQIDDFDNKDDDATARKLHKDFMLDAGWDFAEEILGLKWILFKNQSDSEFWTSDHPITRYNRYDHGWKGNLGYRSEGIEIYFPLSPDICLSFVDSTHFAGNPSKIELGESERDQDHITLVNELQVKQSKRHIFSKSDNYGLANRILDKYPRFASLDRERISVE